MGYKIRHCVVCDKEIHVHEKEGMFILKNICEHVTSTEFTRRYDVDKEFSIMNLMRFRK